MVSLRCFSSMMLLIGATFDFKFLILAENKSFIRTSILLSSSLGLLQPTQYFNRPPQVFIIIIFTPLYHGPVRENFWTPLVRALFNSKLAKFESHIRLLFCRSLSSGGGGGGARLYPNHTDVCKISLLCRAIFSKVFN